VLSAIRFLIENDEARSLGYEELFEILKPRLESEGFNLLNSYVDESGIRIYVQTPSGLEQLVIDENLFGNYIFEEAIRIYSKIKERDVSFGKDFIEILDEIEKSSKKGAYIQRYKGLGEMNPEQLWETTMDPERRVLLKVMMDEENASEIDLTFNTLMGDKVEPRREFIEQNAKYVRNLDI